MVIFETVEDVVRECRACGETKPLSEFCKNRQCQLGREWLCLECKRKRNNDSYRKHKKFGTGRKYANLEFFLELKKSRGCSNCGEDTSCCLDFHHINPEEKEFGIYDGLSWSLDRVKVELEKCTVLCANCHRKIHAGLPVRTERIYF